MNRVTAGPNAWTFKIKPIKELLDRYVLYNGLGWVDPYAGKNSPAQYTNDHNPEMPSKWHLDAAEFCEKISAGDLSYYEECYGRKLQFWPEPPYNGILFDPPYSYRQITEHYKSLGMKASQLDTSSNFYNRVMNKICDSISEGGYAISFGWNSNGFGKNRGFQIVEILLVAHGQHHNDTIVTVEQKV